MLFLLAAVAGTAHAAERTDARAGVAVGAQYDTTHVYVNPAGIDAFVTSFVSTFGGRASPRIVANVLPVASSTQAQYVWTPFGTLSTFAFLTPIPAPFGFERTGYLVTDMDAAIAQARAAGAEVVVAPFKDPIGLDAVIRWPGGVMMQLYWHFKAPDYPPLTTIPENRVYVSADAVEAFLRGFLRFSHGRIVSDERRADAGEIGRSGESYRRVRVESTFGRMQVMVTDGHLPYPFAHEMTGYEVKDLDALLARAKASGARVLVEPFRARDRVTAMLAFPGDYIAEIHAAVAP